MRAIPSSTPNAPKEVISGLSCPDCFGVLGVSVEGRGRRLRFRCRIGHLYTLEEVIAGKEQLIENHLWAAVTALSELETLLDEETPPRAKDAARARSRPGSIARAFTDRAKVAARQQKAVRRVLAETRPTVLGPNDPSEHP
jgi:two-component system chemotaxis response regulator CheB